MPLDPQSYSHASHNLAAHITPPCLGETKDRKCSNLNHVAGKSSRAKTSKLPSLG